MGMKESVVSESSCWCHLAWQFLLMKDPLMPSPVRTGQSMRICWDTRPVKNNEECLLLCGGLVSPFFVCGLRTSLRCMFLHLAFFRRATVRLGGSINPLALFGVGRFQPDRPFANWQAWILNRRNQWFQMVLQCQVIQRAPKIKDTTHSIQKLVVTVNRMRSCCVYLSVPWGFSLLLVLG